MSRLWVLFLKIECKRKRCRGIPWVIGKQVSSTHIGDAMLCCPAGIEFETGELVAVLYVVLSRSSLFIYSNWLKSPRRWSRQRAILSAMRSAIAAHDGSNPQPTSRGTLSRGTWSRYQEPGEKKRDRERDEVAKKRHQPGRLRQCQWIFGRTSAKAGTCNLE